MFRAIHNKKIWKLGAFAVAAGTSVNLLQSNTKADSKSTQISDWTKLKVVQVKQETVFYSLHEVLCVQKYYVYLLVSMIIPCSLMLKG